MEAEETKAAEEAEKKLNKAEARGEQRDVVGEA